MNKDFSTPNCCRAVVGAGAKGLLESTDIDDWEDGDIWISATERDSFGVGWTSFGSSFEGRYGWGSEGFGAWL